MPRAVDLVCLGRAAVDVYCLPNGDEEHHLGGVAANVAVGFRRHQRDAAIQTRVGNDDAGHYVRRALGHTGVNIAALQVDAEHQTPCLRIDVETGSREPAVPNEAAADLFLETSDIDMEMIAGARLLLVTGTSLAAEPSRGTVLAAARHAAKTSTRVVLDLDVRPACWPDGLAALTGAVERIAPSCALVVGTERELETATGVPADAAAETLRRWGDGDVIIKRGARGATLVRADGSASAPGFSVRVEDDMGAGDAFLSAYLDAWLDDEPIATRLRRANAAGALVAGKRGCATAMPTRAEVAAVLSG